MFKISKSFPFSSFKIIWKGQLSSWIIMVLVVCCICNIKLSNALLCYTCSYAEGEIDNSCMLNPDTTGRTTNCTKKYCTIMRQEAVSPAGKVISFIRDCQDKPVFLNIIKTDSTFKTYYRSCMTDLCNDADGVQSATQIDPNFGASDNTIIKGKNNAISSKCIEHAITIGSTLLVLILNK